MAMNKKTDDELLAQFFQEHRIEPADAGFTDRVMKSLPRRTVWPEQVWTGCFIIMLIVYLYQADAMQRLITFARQSLTDIVVILANTEISLTSVGMLLAGTLVMQWVVVHELVQSES